MSNEKIRKALEIANSNVSIEGEKNNPKDLRVIEKALKRAENDGSFFWELVMMQHEKNGNTIGENDDAEKQR